MPRRKTHREFVKQIKKIEPNIKILGKYKSDKVKIDCLCKKCGNKFKGIPSNMVQGAGCKKCANIKIAKSRKKSTDQFKKELSKVNPDIKVLGKYKNNKTDIMVYCKKHNYKWSAKPHNLLEGKGCPECKREKIIKHHTKTHLKFIEELQEINPSIEVLGKYKGGHFPLKCRCKMCGEVITPLPSNLLKGQGCFFCGIKKRASKRRMKQKEFEKELKKVNANLEILGKYTNQQSKILVKCKKDSYSWEPKAQHLLNGHGCPICNESKGEKEVKKYLKNNGYNFKREYIIDDCKNIESLRFDFAVLNKEKLLFLIEYQGIQHYKPIEFFGGKRSFEYRKKNDNIKRNYCKHNDIKLIEIPYTVNDIDMFLDDKIK